MDLYNITSRFAQGNIVNPYHSRWIFSNLRILFSGYYYSIYLAAGSVIVSTNLAICSMISIWSPAWVCNNLLITTTDSATTASSLLDKRCTKPFKHVSVTSSMVAAHLPIDWIVAATQTLSWPVKYWYFYRVFKWRFNIFFTKLCNKSVKSSRKHSLYACK